MIMEIWKNIPEYEGYYQVSNLGNIKNTKTNEILVGDINSSGYRRVVLYNPNKKRFFIHRLVAFSFCDGYSKDKVVNHIDGNKTNNSAYNLEWCSRSENDIHAYKNKLRKSYPCNFKHKIIAKYKDGRVYKIYDNTLECENDLNVSRSQIYNCCNKKSKTCKGFILEYN